MKAFAKILVWFLVFLCVAGLTFLGWYYFKAKKILDYSVYCMDNVRSQLGEELEGVVLNDASCNDGACLFKGGVSYEGTDYSFSCNVSSEDNVAVDLQPLVIEKIEIDDTDEIAEVDTGAMIIVFSPTGNTKQIATYISEINGAEFNELVPVTGYTEADLNWRDQESRSYKEFKDESIRPEFENQFNLDGYDTIYIGFPIWFGRVGNIILTLLENYDFSGKKIVLFCTSEHVGIEGAVKYLEPFNLNVIASKRFEQGASKEEVREWLQSF